MEEEYYLDRIRDGSTLSGEISLLLQYDEAAQTTGAISYAASISFFVDGQALGSFHQLGSLGNAHNILGEAIPLEVYLSTCEFSNGAHMIAAARSLEETIVERQVVFQNVISLVKYSPIFDLTPGAEDIEDKAHITAVLFPPQHWEIKITDYDDDVVKVFSGSGATIDIFWDGTDAKGEVVEDDSYLLTITAPKSKVSVSPGFINKNSL
jgi:hypothetical protein